MELAPRIRAFVALRLSAETDRALGELIDELRTPGDGVTWVRSANLHLTLRFLGEAVDSNLIQPLTDTLEAVTQETAAFVVEAHGLGAFPNLARPRVIWTALHSGELIALATRVEKAVVGCGFEPERRRYSPHLTLGRVKSLKGWAPLRQRLEAAIERDSGDSTIDAMTLYESRLSPSGASYRALAQFKFAASAT